MRVHVGCQGFPIARRRYFDSCDTVELATTFSGLPKPETVRRWRGEVPEGFAFSVLAWAPLTHPFEPGLSVTGPFGRRELERCGHFKPTEEVERAWRLFSDFLDALKPRFAVFRTPGTFYPNAAHLRDMYRFFKRIPRGVTGWVWEPRGFWEPELLRRICGDLGLLRATDALCEEDAPAGTVYARVQRREREGLPEGRLRGLLSHWGGRRVYLYFRGPGAWEDARRLAVMARNAGF